jgi:TrkA-N domain
MVVLWLVALLCYWWPRRQQSHAVGLTSVVAMVVIGAVLTTSSLAPCRGGQSQSAVAGWVLNLYVGNPPPYPSGACQGQPPLALQVGGVVCLGATLVGALTVAAALWRQPLARLQARLVRDATIFTGLDTLAMPLLQRLAQTRRPGNIVVIEPDSNHPLLDEARATGANVMIGDPTSPRVLLPIIVDRRGCALSHLYALRQNTSDNEAILAAASSILHRYPPGPERQPHLVARIDDPRHADHWRGLHSGTSCLWFEDALSSQESTASTLINQIFRTGARHLLLCGDSTLALAILLELSRRAWERRGLVEAAGAGSAAHPDASFDEAARHVLAPFPLERVVLLDQRAEDLRREYLATSPRSAVEAMPTVVVEAAAWKDRLLAMLDAMTPAVAAQSAVAVADAPTEANMHEAGRVARLHPDIPVLVLTSDGAGMSDTIFDLLQPFQRTLLVDGELPEDTWSRVARHWHECFRLRHPSIPGDPRTLTGRPWAELDDFIRHDNLLQLRSIMTAVVGRGRRWVPNRAVPPGSFIELNDRDLEEVARAEHTRWYRRRVAAGWSAHGKRDSAGAALTASLVNSRVVPWTELLAQDRAAEIEHLRSQLAQLEDVGFMPIVAKGGPPEAAEFQRIGTVRARRLRGHRPWTRASGDELFGAAGDWGVIDDSGDERTVRDAEFRASYEPLDGDQWRRTGTFRAWQVSEDLVLRTMEGRAITRPGDWVVEGNRGERWPVTDEQFRRTYRVEPDRKAPSA